MDTNKLATLNICNDALANDLKNISTFTFTATYSEFIFGIWESCALWNKSGEADQTSVMCYDEPAKPTAYVKALPYLAELIYGTFDFTHLKLVRLVNLKPDSVIIPHRDFIETENDFYRFHIPIKTDALCFSSEENAVYQMRLGEVWHIDATRAHSAASFSQQDRLHLILDFAKSTEMDACLKIPIKSQGIASENIFYRQKISPATLETCMQHFADLIDHHNFNNILTLLIKLHFTKTISANEVFQYLLSIVKQSNDATLITRAENLFNYLMQNRIKIAA